MLNYNTPLTAEESAFAAEHHHLLLSYLKKARLDFDEFYDIAVFGYGGYPPANQQGQFPPADGYGAYEGPVPGAGPDEYPGGF